MSMESAAPPPAGPGRPGLSFDAYEQAYHALSGADGSPPSQRQLRKYLGTGNNNTLAKYRRRIAEERISDEKPPEPGSLDAELLITVQRLATQIALNEAQVADDRVDEINKDAEQRIRIAETTMEKRLQDTALLEHRATTSETELVQLRKAMDQKDETISALLTDNRTATQENVMLTQSLEEATRQQALQVRELHRCQAALDSATASEKNTAQQTRKEHAQLQNKLLEATLALSALTEKHAGLNARFEDRLAWIESQNTQHQALQERFNQASEVREGMVVKYEDAKREMSGLSVQIAALNAQRTAEQQAYQVDTQRLEQMVQDKNALLVQLQQAFTALSNPDANTR